MSGVRKILGGRAPTRMKLGSLPAELFRGYNRTTLVQVLAREGIILSNGIGPRHGTVLKRLHPGARRGRRTFAHLLAATAHTRVGSWPTLTPTPVIDVLVAIVVLDFADRIIPNIITLQALIYALLLAATHMTSRRGGHGAALKP
jgi:hypothetical protein